MPPVIGNGGQAGNPGKSADRAGRRRQRLAGHPGFRRHRDSPGGAGLDRRSRLCPARRTRPGQDPAAARTRGSAGRVDAGDRRRRTGRAPLHADHAGVDPAGRAARRRPTGGVEAPQRALHREAGHPRHQRRRPGRRRRPDQGCRGPQPRGSRNHRLRAHPAGAPRHRRGQRAARPRRTHPGVDAQRHGGARHPGPRLHAAAAAGCVGGRQRQPRGLHQPWPHHHAHQGPVRRRDPHPLPTGAGGGDGRHRPGGAPECTGARLPDAGARAVCPLPARIPLDRSALRGVGAVCHRSGRNRGGCRPAPRGGAGRQTRWPGWSIWAR